MTTHDNAPPPPDWQPEARRFDILESVRLEPQIPPNIVLGEE